MTGNLSASILARLLTLAKQRGDDYNLLLNRFGMERLLARVSTAPTLRVYPVYTVIAEKYQAMVILGQANSRMKDFFDLAEIARRTELDGATLAAAIAATFARRQTNLPTERPLALTKQFSEDAAKLRQWQACRILAQVDQRSTAAANKLTVPLGKVLHFRLESAPLNTL